MTGIIDARLAELGITLPDAPAPAANYVPFVVAGDMVFISGQVSSDANGLRVGKVGAEVSLEEAQASARACGLALIAQLRKAAGGDLDRVAQVVKLTGFVNAVPDFGQHPAVVNGCSDLMVEVFGDKGRHARAAVGSGSLPFNVQVEIEGIFRLA
ncbi:RidA family protein [Halovulum dunhuangense]|uniref:RidA family protein n=1 Tax=Halovulum dunhuangense TaxID=1505036 RepID=A0A849L662_9RHOB|nr:RidA family protein [Halovulum dunhuangense]NNU81644.1 RidA family protein [Halovulum dunhuangense]